MQTRPPEILFINPESCNPVKMDTLKIEQRTFGSASQFLARLRGFKAKLGFVPCGCDDLIKKSALQTGRFRAGFLSDFYWCGDFGGRLLW